MQSLPAPLRFFLLGEVRLESGGKIIPLPQRESVLRLLVRLLLQIGQPQSRKSLAFALWPDESESEALANLRRHLYLLRNLLPKSAQELLQISPQSVSWANSPDCWLDVCAFERDSGDINEQEQTVELYRGDLALGIDTDDLIIARREEIRSRYLVLLKKLAQTCFEQSQLERALKWSRKLTAQDPWDEESVRLEMTIEAISGNRPAAIATYEGLARELERELNTQPMPETMALYADILNNRLLRPAPPKKTSSDPNFISRAHELAQLANLLSGLRNGQGKIAFISGDAGVGKTSLLREVLRRFLNASGEDAPRLFWGHCHPPAGDTPIRPYAPWRQIVTAAAPLLARSADITPEWLNRLLPLAPDLSLLRPGLMMPSQPDADALRAALRQSLNFLAISRPLVLIVEDIHWIDPSSLAVLQEISDSCQSLPLLLLVTHREDIPLEVVEAKHALRRQRCSQEIHLQTFTTSETRDFLENALGREIPVHLLDEIIRYAQGLPLLLREAVESLRNSQRLQPPGQALPTLQQSIKLRLQQLDQPARQMLETAAVLGFSFSDNELRSLLNWPAATYGAVLDRLQVQRFLLNTTSPGLDDYVFSHHLIHQIILTEIEPVRRACLHADAARALETVHAGKTGFAAEIAGHYQAGALPIPAARFWLKHAQEMNDMAAFEQSLEAIEHAVSLLTESESREAREILAQAALQRGVIAHYRGQAEQALAMLAEALALCQDFPWLHADALTRHAYALYTCDRYLDAHLAASQALSLANSLGDVAAAARALNIRGISALMLGRTREAIDDLRQAVASAAGPSSQMVQSLNHLGTALVFVQEYQPAAETLNKTLELARKGGLKRLEAAALTMLGQISLNCGRYEEAIRVYSASIEVAGASYLPGMWGKYAGRGLAYFRSGALLAARQDYEKGLQVSLQVNSMYGRLLMQSYLVFVALAQMQIPAFSLSQIEKQAIEANLQPVAALCANIRGQGWRLLGNFEQAVIAHQRCLQAALETNVPNFILAARIQLLYDRLLLCPEQTLLAELDDSITQARTASELPILAQGLLVRGRFTADSADAKAFLEEGLALARACPDQPLLAEGLGLLARLEDQTAQSRMFLMQAEAIARQSYAPLLILLGETNPEIEELARVRQILLNALTK